MPTTNATLRQFGQAVSQNVRRRRNMTTAERNIAAGMLRGGASFREIGKVFRHNLSTIRKLYKKFHHTSTIDNKPRSSCLKIISPY